MANKRMFKTIDGSRYGACVTCGRGWGAHYGKFCDSARAWPWRLAPSLVPGSFTTEIPSRMIRAPAPLKPVDPLDVEIDGVLLRRLLESDVAARREMNPFGAGFTPAQRRSISERWSSELRAKVAASAAADKERERTCVTIDQEDF
jgi:hypothetical protein